MNEQLNKFHALLFDYERAKESYIGIRSIFGYPELAKYEAQLLDRLNLATERLDNFILSIASGGGE